MKSSEKRKRRPSQESDRSRATSPSISDLDDDYVKQAEKLVDMYAFAHKVCPASEPKPVTNEEKYEFEGIFKDKHDIPRVCKFNMNPRIKTAMARAERETKEKLRKEKPKPIHLFPRKPKSYQMPDYVEISKAPILNDSFSRLLDRKLPSSTQVNISLTDFTRMEGYMRFLLEAHSRSAWLLTALVKQAEEEGYRPGKESQFMDLKDELAKSMGSQLNTISRMSACMSWEKKKSLLSHASSVVNPEQKKRLILSPIFEENTFSDSVIQEVLEECSLDASRKANVARTQADLAKKRSSQDYKSPVVPRSSGPSTSGYRGNSRRQQPYRPRYQQRRNNPAPSSSSNAKQGFRK